MSNDTFFARYEPGETTPNYRRYRLAFTTSDATLNALCKRRFQPLAADNDQVDLSNVMAMECALKAYRYFQASDFKTYREALVEAIGFLNGELARYQSESEEIIVQVDPTTSMGRVSCFP